MTVFVYHFNNTKGFYAFNQKQKVGSYLTGMLLHAKTKKQLVDLIKERLVGVNSISFMRWNGSNYETVDQQRRVYARAGTMPRPFCMTRKARRARAIFTGTIPKIRIYQLGFARRDPVPTMPAGNPGNKTTPPESRTARETTRPTRRPFSSQARSCSSNKNFLHFPFLIIAFLLYTKKVDKASPKKQKSQNPADFIPFPRYYPDNKNNRNPRESANFYPFPR